MKLQLLSSVLSVSLVTLFFVILVSGEVTTNDGSITTERNEYIKNPLKSIASKIESIQARIHKTLNESKAFDEHIAQTRSESLIKRGYRLTKGVGYHKLYLIPLTWQEALNFCRNELSHLAVIDSTTESSVLGDLIKVKLDFDKEVDEENVAYIGLHDYCKNGSWINIFFDVLDNVDYLHWKQGASNNNRVSNVPNCAVIDQDGKLSSVRCTSKQAFICESKL